MVIAIALTKNINVTESRSREKKLLMEELVQIKKLKEIANQDITYKESELVNIKQELERTTAQANDEIHQVYLLETQVRLMELWYVFFAQDFAFFKCTVFILIMKIFLKILH